MHLLNTSDPKDVLELAIKQNDLLITMLSGLNDSFLKLEGEHLSLDQQKEWSSIHLEKIVDAKIASRIFHSTLNLLTSEEFEDFSRERKERENQYERKTKKTSDNI